MAGFWFRYRLNGGAPTVESFSLAGTTLTAGDFVSREGDSVRLSGSGTAALLGAVQDAAAGTVRVITDADAVYGVTDATARVNGQTVDLQGATGGQRLSTSVNGDLTVVADSAADAETLVRIGAARAGLVGGELNAAVARAVVHHLSEVTGRGPTKAQAFYRGNVVVVVLEEALTKGERHLVARGEEGAVLKLREALQEVLRGQLVESIEELTGRRVRAFMSANSLDPDMATEVFVLDRPVDG